MVDGVTQFELTNEYLDRLKEAIDQHDISFIKESLAGVKPADITDTLHEFNAEDSKYVIDLLEPEIGAEIIKDLDEDVRLKFLKSFTPDDISNFLVYMDSDDAVDILNEQPIKIREEAIAKLEDQEKVNYIMELLRYDEDCAGGLMAKELIKANLNWTVIQCIEEIRRQAGKIQKIYSVYVVDDQDKLLGRVSLKKIILADDSLQVKDIYEDNVIAVETYLDEDEVAAIMRKYDLDAVPVINVKGKLLGRITIDDIIDVITEQAEEERQLMSGISEDVEEDDSIWMLSRARLPWLIIGLAGGVLGASLIGFFEKDLIRITAIAFFIPLIMATGGNVGIQSSSLVVQSLANPSAFNQPISKKLVKVLIVALINGILLSGIVFGVVSLINNSNKLAFVVSLALFTVVVIASFLGTLVPLLLDKIKINPALASGPFITTAIDLVGLAVYFSVAHLLYNL